MTTPSPCTSVHILRKSHQLAECVTNLSAEKNRTPSIVLSKVAEIAHDSEVIDV